MKETLTDAMQLHRNEEEIHKQFMFNDIRRWEEEAAMIRLEMDFYTGLLKSLETDPAAALAAGYPQIREGINEAQLHNERFRQRLLGFTNQLEGIIECDDLQCEAFFLNDHARLKVDIEQHFSQYKSFKEKIFNCIQHRNTI